MKTRLVAFSIIPFAVVAIVFGALSTTETININSYDVAGLDLNYSVSNELTATAEEKQTDCFYYPVLNKSFVGFKEALAFKESRGDYQSVNTLGYLGKYQFGRTTLQRFRIYNTQDFLRNPELQERAFLALCKVNKWILRKDIDSFQQRMKPSGLLQTHIQRNFLFVAKLQR